MRTSLKGLRLAIEKKDKEAATALFPKVQALISKLVKTSALKKSTAGRRIGRIASQVSKL